MGKRIVVALGGNALQTGKEASSEAQKVTARNTAAQIAALVQDGHQVLVVHGNGPQVGNIVLHEEAINTPETPTSPLDTCVAMSQGQIGYWLQQALQDELQALEIARPTATIVTQTLVSSEDPAFANPSKPIGPFYADEAAAVQMAQEKGYIVKEDAGRGWRRVVASPLPIDIIEKDFIKKSLEMNMIVIAAGGGGIPVIKRDGRVQGVAAVVDKDFAAEKIAELIDADILLILTGVEKVTINFNTPQETPISTTTVAQMEQYITDSQFAPGSMLPKVQAANMFAKSRPNNVAIITTPEKATAAINGQTGTRIQNG